MVNKNKIAKSTFIIIIFSLASKFLGFFRDVLIAAKFGSGIETDTFFIALTATGMLAGFYLMLSIQHLFPLFQR